MAKRKVELELVHVRAGDTANTAHTRALFSEYRAYLLSLGCDVAAFQGFEAELANIPGKYAPPRGVLLLLRLRHPANEQQPQPPVVEVFPREVGEDVVAAAEAGGEGARCVACIALHELEKGVGEVKRLFVRDAWSRLGLGQALSLTIVRLARELGGFRVLRLDTLERLPRACALYDRLGFRRIGAYCVNPLPDAVYMEFALDDGAQKEAV